MNTTKEAKEVIGKIENSNSIKEINNIVAVVNCIKSWTNSEKSIINHYANNSIEFLKCQMS